MTGIYKIQSKVKPERIYIGSAVDIKHRWNDHLSNLRNNKHHSIKLQRHSNKYGIIDLQFSIILPCEKELLIKNEQFFIDANNPWFNICPNAGSCLGKKLSEDHKAKIVKSLIGNKRTLGFTPSDESKEKNRLSNLGSKNAFYGKTHSESTREKMRLNHYNCKKENNSFYGKKHTKETKDNMAKLNKGKFKLGNNPSAKIVVDLCNGIFYSCAKEAQISISDRRNMSITYFRSMLNGTNPNKTNFIYV